MTVAKAKVVFATHMQVARTRKLTTYERNQLATARQVLRTSRKPVTGNTKRVSNPKQPGVLIYEHVDCIYATKGPGHICDAECKKNGHRYYHEFKSRPKMYGLKDGSILIKS